MKLIINIPELDYECSKQRWMSGNDAHQMDYYISKGVPLDDIKAEIEKMATYDEWVRYFLDNGATINLAENMAKAESEEMKDNEFSK